MYDPYMEYLLEKCAAGGVWGTLARGGKWLGTAAFGKPRQFFQQARAGELLKPGGLVREGFAAPSMLSKGLMYGMPAYEAYKLVKDKEGDKASRLGGLIGGTLAGNALAGGFGIVGGGLVGGTIGRAIGSRIGGTMQYMRDKRNGTLPPVPTTPHPSSFDPDMDIRNYIAYRVRQQNTGQI